MQKYDPERPSDPKEWLGLGEGVRTNLIADYHDAAGDELPNPRLHGICHGIVENQIAMGEEVPARTLQLLTKEGLGRHGAIHAVGSVLVEQIYYTMTDAISSADVNKQYARRLESLTAEKWWKSG